MALKYPDRLESNNPAAYGIVKATEIAGHKLVADLTALYALADPILSVSGNNTDNDAIGLEWFVADLSKYYRLIDWTNRKRAEGWQAIEDYTQDKAFVDSLKSEEANVGDVVFYDKEKDNLTIVSEWSAETYPAEKYTPIGVVVIPSSHNVWGDGKAGVMSLKAMKHGAPETGDLLGWGICWGQYNTDIELKNFDEVVTTDKGAQINGYIKTDYYNPSSRFIVSPFNEDGSRNPAYYDTSLTDANAMSDFDGVGNTNVLINLATAQPDWKTAAWIENKYDAGYSPAACCCARFRTEGTNPGDWYLPACGELGYVAVKKTEINEVISNLNSVYGSVALSLSDTMYLSSSEHGKYGIRIIRLDTGSADYHSKADNMYVRAFLRVSPKLSSIDKNISNLQSQLNKKVDKNVAVNGHQLSSSITLTKTDIGLGNVTNDALVKRSEMGVVNGVATLDGDGKVPASQLPSYVDDIVDVYATYSKSNTGILSNIVLYSDAAKTKQVTGEGGKIYQNVTNGEPGYQFRWTGSVFAQTGASSLIIGEVAGTAYDGAKGKANADNITKIKNTLLSHIKDDAPITTTADKVSLNYECYAGEQYGHAGNSHTADIPAATTTKAGVMSAADKATLDTHVSNTSNPHSVTKALVGLGNVDNTSDANKPVSTAQAAAITAAVEALGATVTSTDGNNVLVKVTEANGKITGVNITTDNTATNSDLTAESNRATAVEASILTLLDYHKNNLDKKHIPEGGHEQLILAWKADGEAQWEDPANMFTGLEELLCYGVEWDITVADPHITRIGNMSLHRTLPIQSQLKGCIALADKVIYWLDENDWNFKANTTLDISSIFKAVDNKNKVYSEDNKSLIINDSDFKGAIEKLLKGSETSLFVRYAYSTLILYLNCLVTNLNIHITIADLNNLSDINANYILLTGWGNSMTTFTVGERSRLDGYDGTVRVYCPNFYIKSVINGNKRRVWLSTVKIDNTWTYQHEILIDAYRSTVLNTVPENMGYLSSLPVNSAISVVNTAAYCRGGGNRTANDKYLTGADDTPIDIFRTDLGKPRTNYPRSGMRKWSRNAGSEMLSYDQYKNIFYWLYVVEYANFNCQEAYSAALTEEGYHQGGMGPSITDMSDLSLYNNYYPITPCGYGNSLGNGTGLVPLTIPEFTYGEANTVMAAQTVQMARWRGFDNPFGDIWTNLDGIIIDANADNHPNNMHYVYTCQDPDKYADSLNGEGYEKVGEETHQEGYIKLFDLGDAAHIFPNVIGGNNTQFKCDFHWAGISSTTLRVPIVGGRASSGAYAGLGYFDSSVSNLTRLGHVGFRSVSRVLTR